MVLLGVRGSTPAPGAAFLRYGGHTSSVAVLADDDDVPHVVLDAGTGIRTLPALMSGAPFRGSVLLSHLHWDHVQGLPFSSAVDRDDSEVRLFCPGQDGKNGRDLLAQLMSPPGFPITPEGLRGSWQFRAMEPGRQQVEGFTVTAFDAPHKGGRTFGYRVQDDDGAVVYLPDHSPKAGCSDELMAAVRGADVLVHDAQFLESERAVAEAYGHATVDDAVALARRAQVPALALFHHGPQRTDDAIDRIVDDLAPSSGLEIVAAREGDVVGVPV